MDSSPVPKQSLRVLDYRERPCLEEQFVALQDVWPPFMLQDAVARRFGHQILTAFPEYSIYLCDADGEVVAGGKGVPLFWDGMTETIPGGFDAALIQAISERELGRPPNTFCALSATVRHTDQGCGVSKQILQAMKVVAQRAGLARMIAPVRPTLKARYPLIPIERYSRWTRADGSPFDPWLRVHWREGATIICSAPASMRIVGSVHEWETWAGMTFPQTGEYVVPGALCPISIDRETDQGIYVEPNVWMLHTVERGMG